MSDEVLRWSRTATAPFEVDEASDEAPSPAPDPRPGPATLVAANGDVAVEYLLARLTAEGRPVFGHVQADRFGGIELLRRNDVLATGCHGDDIPGKLDGERLAFVHLVQREVVLAFRRSVRLTDLHQIGKYRLASRPSTAGVRTRFDEELRNRGIDPDAVHGRALVLPSHREVACAVARGDSDVGLASWAWADRVGLQSIPLFREAYGLLVRASLLGDPRIVALCGTVQTPEFRREMTAVRGYEARMTGTISYVLPKQARRSAGNPSPKGRPS